MNQHIIPSFNPQDGTRQIPTTYDELVYKKAQLEQKLQFANEQLNYYTNTLASLKDKLETLMKEWPEIVEESNKAKDAINKIKAKLNDNIKLDFNFVLKHKYLMINWDYDNSIRYYNDEIDRIEAKMPEYKINVKLAEKALAEIDELFNI